MQIYNTYWYISTYTSHESRSSTTAVDPVKLIWFDMIWPQGRAAFHCKKGLANVRDKKPIRAGSLYCGTRSAACTFQYLHELCFCTLQEQIKRWKGKKKVHQTHEKNSVCTTCTTCFVFAAHWKESPADKLYKLYKCWRLFLQEDKKAAARSSERSELQ